MGGDANLGRRVDVGVRTAWRGGHGKRTVFYRASIQVVLFEKKRSGGGKMPISAAADTPEPGSLKMGGGKRGGENGRCVGGSFDRAPGVRRVIGENLFKDSGWGWGAGRIKRCSRGSLVQVAQSCCKEDAV